MNLREVFSEFEIRIMIESLDLYEIKCELFIKEIKEKNDKANVNGLKLKSTRARQIKEKIINNLTDI
jgi:hypothetical protein